METRVATIISYLFHPLFVPLYSLLLIFQLETISVFIITNTAKMLILALTALTALALPLLLFWLFRRKGIIASMKMESRQERAIPLVIMTLVYYLMYFLFAGVRLPAIANAFFLGTAIVLLVVALITFRWKISMHTAAMGGMTGAFLAIAFLFGLNLLWLIALLIFISGMVAYARLKLNAHSAAEVYSGWAVGMMVMMLVYFLW